MQAGDLIEKYLQFFESKQHKPIPSASLVPENDPTVLFTTAGMHPLVPFLMGRPHPLGQRLVNVQKCIRTGDIEETGDSYHHTFFEMLGNWSLGDYFKKESIEWSYEFLTDKKWLGLDPERLAISCFKGDETAEKDEESAAVWRSMGIPEERIAFLGKDDNWWGPAGETGPCGPDTEMFYWKGDSEPPKAFDPDDDTWVEIWNDVFMQYEKLPDGSYIPLEQQNVDTGMGVDRVVAVLQGFDDDYRTEQFWPVVEKIQKLSGRSYEDETTSMRIIADHLRAAVFILADERTIRPSNLDQGYVLRRFIRRAIRHARLIGIQDAFCADLGKQFIAMYKGRYPELESHRKVLLEELAMEEERFSRTIENGMREYKRISEKMAEHDQKEISAKVAFLLFQSYGFPLEMTQELAQEDGLSVDVKGFEKQFKKHQELSRKGAEQKFKGGLADAKEHTIQLHTATHLLNEALRRVVSKEIVQKGSNITAERLRFDFNFPRRLTKEEITAVEDEVNRAIKEGMTVSKEEMSLEEAKTAGAQSEFGARYPDVVSVYTIKEYSKEICGGPHVKNTKDIGKFRITKEQSSAAGIRRIKAVVE